MKERFKHNRLGDATSPYLLQHKDNPVHWQPWEAAVFDEARRRNVPVLLSVGYAACHWCHVMAHESFEDDEVAALMNAHFVCIKLDREERPDLDEIYMSALSMMGEQGGWPLTMCLDADAKPFWGGTYFPKHPQAGRPGFMQILTEISRIWHEAPEKINKNTGALTQALSAQAQADARGDMPTDLPHRAAHTLATHIDRVRGGLSGAPKFPQPFLYQFLWQQAQIEADDALAESVIVTLEKICQGGIYDHIGGGFARYSVDADWLVPHFEKMLYDNALLLTLMTQIWRRTKSPLLAQRIDETIGWLARDMVLPSGAFAASLDADTQGEEGKFYVWSKDEVEALLQDHDAAGFCAAYNITAAGNFEGRNIPHLLTAGDAVMDAHAPARAVLLAARQSRVMPGRDDKILADWNGLMIAALVQAATAFERDDWLAMARTGFDAARHALSDKDGVMRHSARDGRVLPITLAADLAFMGQAGLALYGATNDAAHLIFAEHCAARLSDDYQDEKRGGFFANAAAETDLLLVNNRPVQDNAMPSANAAALGLWAGLAQTTGRQDYLTQAHDLFAALAGHLNASYPSMTAFLAAHQKLSHPLSVIIIAEACDSAESAALARTARRHAIFDAHIAIWPQNASLPETHPAYGKLCVNAQPTAYICRGHLCLPPITAPDDLSAALDAVMAQRQTEAVKADKDGGL